MKYLQFVIIGGALLLLGASCTPSGIPTEQPTSPTSSLGTGCQTTADCGAVKEVVCENSVCVAAPPGGTVCGSGANTWRCDHDQWCGIQSGQCSDTPFCMQISDCATGQVCINGYCGPAAGLNNTSNSTSSCNSNSQCTSGKLCVNGHCATPEARPVASCIKDSDCGVKGWSCNDGTCAAWAPGGLACSYYVNGVQENWRCNNDQWCGIRSGDCRNEPFCQKSSDCSSNEVCVNGYCGPEQTRNEPNQTCTSQSDCVNGKICMDNLCVPAENYNADNPPTECSLNSDCEIGKNCYGGYCVQPPSFVPENCSADSDCPGGQKCNGFTCYIVVTNPDRCTSDVDCVEKMSFCQNNKCVFAPGGNAD